MSVRAGYVTPMLHVAEIERSIRFYQLLGFEVVDHQGDNPIGWARMHCEGGALMFFLSEECDGASAPNPWLFYLYTPDLPAFREHLASHGVTVPNIKHPPYMPSGELTLHDPDGNLIFVGHWSDQEHEAWLKNKKPL